jgi:hypothetical protein
LVGEGLIPPDRAWVSGHDRTSPLGARAQGVSKAGLSVQPDHYRAGGYEALTRHWRRPHTRPNGTPLDVKDEIVRVRKNLVDASFDAGARMIHWHRSKRRADVPSVSTIWWALGPASPLSCGLDQESRTPPNLADRSSNALPASGHVRHVCLHDPKCIPNMENTRIGVSATMVEFRRPGERVGRRAEPPGATCRRGTSGHASGRTSSHAPLRKSPMTLGRAGMADSQLQVVVR